MTDNIIKKAFHFIFSHLSLKIVRVEPEVISFTLGERPPGWPRAAGLGVEVRALDTELAAHCVQAPGAVVLVGIPAWVPGGAQL